MGLPGTLHADQMDDGTKDAPQKKCQDDLFPAKDESAGCHQLDIPASDGSAGACQVEDAEKTADANRADQVVCPVVFVQHCGNHAKHCQKKVDSHGNLVCAPVNDTQDKKC